MFIDAGTCFFDLPLHEALAAWNSKGCVDITWGNLVRRSLVKVVRVVKGVRGGNSEAVEVIWVHEHLRGLAKKISQRRRLALYADELDKVVVDPRDVIWFRVAEWSVDIWCDSSVTKTKERGGVNRETFARLFLFDKGKPRLRIPPRFQLESLEHLENLKYLYLDPVNPAGLNKNFPRSISLLHWPAPFDIRYQSHPHLPQIGWEGMHNLGSLYLACWTIPMEFLEALGNLISLRSLDLTYVLGVISLPQSFGHLTCLERLRLCNLDLKNLPATFGLLTRLEYLVICCRALYRLPANFGNLSALTHLELTECSCLEELPASFGMLSSLETFKLNGCSTLQRLPENFGQLKALTQLTISGASLLQALPDNFGNFSALEHLELKQCSRLEELPESFGMLSSLKKCMLTGCSMLQRLPDSFGGLQALTHLTISGASLLQALPESLGNLRSLSGLELISFPVLKNLPESLGNLSSLSGLELISFPVLKNLPTTLGLLTGMRKLVIEDGAFCKLPDNFGNLSALEHLELKQCSRLEQLPANFGMLPSLEKCMLTGCSMLQRLSDSFGELKALTQLTISGASLLQALPDSLGNLRSFSRLELIKCPLLEELPANFGGLSMIKSESTEASEPKDLKSALHELITCDDCGMYPIEGSRYVSIKERSIVYGRGMQENFDLCFDCFEKADNPADYIGIRHPPERDSIEIHITSCPSMKKSVLLSLGWLVVWWAGTSAVYQRTCLEKDSCVH